MSFIERQQKILSFFDRQKTLDRISHAYLLVGKHDTFEVALEMAKRIFCENGGCNHCAICQRIDQNEFADLSILSGKETSIKKDEVIALKEMMAQTSLESTSKKVYILQDVEHASLSAMNSLLKFLEEPESEIIAILTTQNVNKVLETIQSRCMILTLQPLVRHDLVKEIQAQGFPKREAIYLSYITKSAQEAKKIGETTLFNELVDLCERLFQCYEKKEYEVAGIIMQIALKNLKMDLKSMQWLCMMHLAFYHDFKEKDRQYLPVLQASIVIQDRIRPGVVASMLMDQYAYELAKGVRG